MSDILSTERPPVSEAECLAALEGYLTEVREMMAEMDARRPRILALRAENERIAADIKFLQVEADKSLARLGVKL